VAQQKLAGAEIADLLVEQRDLGPAKTVRAVRSRIQPDEGDPPVDQVLLGLRTAATSDLCWMARGSAKSTRSPDIGLPNRLVSEWLQSIFRA